MDWRTVDLANCPVAKAVEIVGQRWTLLLLREAFNGIRRFDDFCAHLEMPRASLARRLHELTDAGLFERRPYRDEGSRERHEYRPTEMAWGLYPVVVGLMQWGDAYLGDDQPPLLLVDRHSGRRVKVAVVPEDTPELAPRDVERRPGPTFRTLAGDRH